MLPKVLNKEIKKLKALDNREIGKVVLETVKNEMTRDMLIGEVANRLLANKSLNKLNDISYNFKKALLIRVSRVIDKLNIKYKVTKSMAISNDGTMYPVTHRTIINREDKIDKTKVWFKEATSFQDYVTLKGSNKLINNNSYNTLFLKSTINMIVKTIDSRYVDLYAVLTYEKNKTKVNEDLNNYYNRLQSVAKETIASMGLSYKNYRKLDSNSRNYPLNRYGFSYEYGDKFQKYMVEVDQSYKVNEADVDGAINYLKDEYGCKIPIALYLKSKKTLEDNLELLKEYKKGKIVNFTIDGKELGDLLHICDVYENIIDNLNGCTRTRVAYDFTNSGGINASNQFGDSKFLKTMNLLGGETKYDTHQAIADYLGVPRDKAKKVMQGPNHGSSIGKPMLKLVNSLGGRQLESIKELEDMVYSIFGESYKYIRYIAEYGIKLAKKGVTHVEIVRPDGVKAIWYPYMLNSKVPLEDGTTVSAIMPFNTNMNGTVKASGLAVSMFHSSDSFIEHYVQSNMLSEGHAIKTILDNFYMRPSLKDRFVELTFEALNMLEGHIKRNLINIEKQTGIKFDHPMPERNVEIVMSDNII